jgi:hypothetical protein
MVDGFQNTFFLIHSKSDFFTFSLFIMNRSILIALRTALLLLVVSGWLPNAAYTQNSTPLSDWLESYRFSGDFKRMDLFRETGISARVPANLDHAITFQWRPDLQAQLLEEAPLTLTVDIPNAFGGVFTAELVRTTVVSPDFSTAALDHSGTTPIDYRGGLHYRGILRDNPQSMVALSFFETETMGMVVTESGNYQLGPLTDQPEILVLYRSDDLPAAHSCFTDENLHSFESAGGADDRGVGCKVVNVYFECDYKLYQDRGSNTTNVNNYVTAVFNQVATLYSNENIGIAISQIFIWTTPDPYQSYTSTATLLNAFRTTRGTNFNGNLAHFLSTRNLGGGIAYVDVICLKQYAFGVSAITNTYQNVPVYSWTVEVVTHELGHNLGAWHTHSCNWPGGALDNCVAPEGNCAPGPAPGNGGTIMSYCHLTSAGINFNNGFGAVPGNHIRNKVLNATCLAQTGAAPTGLNSSNVTNNSATVAWGAVSGATSYTVQYKTSLASTWTTAGATTNTSLSISGLAASTTYQWQVKTDCSAFSATATFTTSAAGGGGNTCNPPTGLTTSSITSTTAVLGWGAVAGASSYTVQFKTSTASQWQTAGSTAGLSYNLINLSAATTYQWQVKANCSVYSASITFNTPATGGGGGGTACNPPGGLTNVSIAATSAIIKWNVVSGASNYTLQLKYTNSNTWFTLGTVSSAQVTLSGLQPSSSYQWRVKASCSNYSAPVTLNTPANFSTPATGETPAVAELSIQVFPNPTQQWLNITSAGLIPASCTLRLLDLSGRLVLEEPLLDYTRQVSVENLPPGCYLLEILENGQRIEVKKVIKL